MVFCCHRQHRTETCANEGLSLIACKLHIVEFKKMAFEIFELEGKSSLSSSKPNNVDLQWLCRVALSHVKFTMHVTMT